MPRRAHPKPHNPAASAPPYTDRVATTCRSHAAAHLSLRRRQNYGASPPPQPRAPASCRPPTNASPPPLCHPPTRSRGCAGPALGSHQQSSFNAAGIAWNIWGAIHFRCAREATRHCLPWKTAVSRGRVCCRPENVATAVPVWGRVRRIGRRAKGGGADPPLRQRGGGRQRRSRADRLVAALIHRYTGGVQCPLQAS